MTARPKGGCRILRDGDASTSGTRERHQTVPPRPQQDDSNEPVAFGDVCALLTLVMTAMVFISGVAYAGHHILSQVARYTTMDVIRMVSPMP